MTKNFNSRPLYRGRLVLENSQRYLDISTHAPYTEGDDSPVYLRKDIAISTHAPYTEGDHIGRLREANDIFQLTPPIQRATGSQV